MRKVTLVAACVLAVAAMSTANAQCNRGGRGGSAAGTVSPMASATGLNSPLAAFNSFNSSPSASLLAAQYRQQRAQYQNLLAQQQRNMQLMARRQQMLERQLRQMRSSESTSSEEFLASRGVDSRKERLREQNAQKAFQLAIRAEASGRTSMAESQYRRVIRIVGADSELGSRATDAIAALSDDSDLGETMLASVTVR